MPLITQASSEQSICFAVPSESADSVINALQVTFASEIEDEDIDRVWMTEDVSIITVVGVGMRHTPGVAGQALDAAWKQQSQRPCHRTRLIRSIDQHGRRRRRYRTGGKVIA